VDPTDARALVRSLARQAGVDPDAVLGRDRKRAIVLARRHIILELVAAGLSWSAAARAMGRSQSTVYEAARPWRPMTQRRRRIAGDPIALQLNLDE
jgi:DNA-binding NarL/FixJ family response regulator